MLNKEDGCLGPKLISSSLCMQDACCSVWLFIRDLLLPWAAMNESRPVREWIMSHFSRIWSKAAHIKCSQPGQRFMCGYTEVIKSWYEIFKVLSLFSFLFLFPFFKCYQSNGLCVATLKSTKPSHEIFKVFTWFPFSSSLSISFFKCSLSNGLCVATPKVLSLGSKFSRCYSLFPFSFSFPFSFFQMLSKQRFMCGYTQIIKSWHETFKFPYSFFLFLFLFLVFKCSMSNDSCVATPKPWSLGTKCSTHVPPFYDFKFSQLFVFGYTEYSCRHGQRTTKDNSALKVGNALFLFFGGDYMCVVQLVL